MVTYDGPDKGKQVACFNTRVMGKGALLRRVNRDNGPQIEDFRLNVPR